VLTRAGLGAGAMHAHSRGMVSSGQKDLVDWPRRGTAAQARVADSNSLQIGRCILRAYENLIATGKSRCRLPQTCGRFSTHMLPTTTDRLRRRRMAARPDTGVTVDDIRVPNSAIRVRETDFYHRLNRGPGMTYGGPESGPLCRRCCAHLCVRRCTGCARLVF